MADLYDIKFSNHGLSGNILMSASEGEFKFRRGLFRRRMVIEDVLDGVVFKDGCQGTAKHTLTIEYATTSTNVSTIGQKIYDRLQAIWDGKEGTLEVPEQPALTRCVVTDIDLTEQVRVLQPTPLNTASTGFAEGVTLVATIQIEQTGA